MARSKRWKRYRAPVAVAVLVAIAGTAYAVARKPADAESTTRYVTEAAATGTLSVTVSGTGNLELRDEVAVYPDTSGSVASVKVAEGETVEKGDVLLVLDDDDATDAKAQKLASLRQAQEGVARAKLSVAQAEAALDALEERAEIPTQTVRDSEIDNAESQVDIAKMALTSAKATLASAQTEYNEALAAFDELEVVAPCDGIVWSLNVASGDAVSPRTGGSTSTAASSSGASSASALAAATGGTSSSSSSSGSSSAAVTIARDGELALKLTVNETDISSVKKGQSAELTFDAIPDLAITGKVDEVSNKGTVSSGVVTYDLWVTLDVADERLKTGMSATAVVVTDVVRDALLVSNSAIKSDDTAGDYVLVMSGGESEPQSLPVTIGLANATKTVVTAGLKAGDKVVTKTVDTSDSDSESGGFMMGAPRGMGGR